MATTIEQQPLGPGRDRCNLAKHQQQSGVHVNGLLAACQGGRSPGQGGNGFVALGVKRSGLTWRPEGGENLLEYDLPTSRIHQLARESIAASLRRQRNEASDAGVWGPD